MKNLVLGMMLLGSFSAFSFHEYERLSVECSISGDSSTITNIELKPFGKTLDFKFIVTKVKNSSEVVRLEVIDDQSVINKEALSYVAIKGERIGEFQLELSQNETNTLIDYLSDKNSIVPPRGVNYSDYFGNYLSESQGFSDRIQLHYAPTENDGLSYHLNLKCSKIKYDE